MIPDVSSSLFLFRVKVGTDVSDRSLRYICHMFTALLHMPTSPLPVPVPLVSIDAGVESVVITFLGALAPLFEQFQSS